MLKQKGRTPVMPKLYDMDRTTTELRDVKATIDRSVRILRKKQMPDEDIVAYLKRVVDKYFAEKKLQLAQEQAQKLDKIYHNIRCRTANKHELELELDLLEKELSDLAEDYKLLAELYKKHNILSQDEEKATEEV